MSWSFNAKGTKAGALRQIAEAKCFVTALEEVAAVAKYRALATEMIENANVSNTNMPSEYEAVFEIAFAGHGAGISSFKFALCEYLAIR